MKNKTITIILSSLLVVSIGINIWQYSRTNSLNASVATLQDDINNLKADMDSQNNAISNKDTEITDLTSTIEELKTENESLKADINSSAGDEIAKDEEIAKLNTTIQELETEIAEMKKASTQQSKPSGNTGTGGGGSSQQPSGGTGQPSGGNGGGGGQPSGGSEDVTGGALSGLPEMGAGGVGSGEGPGLNWTTD